jgi:hypothetical protein
MPAALLFDIGLAVAGQRGNHLHTLPSQEFGGVLLPRPEQHGEVAAVDHGLAQRARFAHQGTEMRIHLRRTTGKVDGMDGRRVGQQLQQAFNRGRLHDLGALGSRFHVAVMAGQVAKLAHVDLQDFQRRARQAEAVLAQAAGE